MASKSVHMPNTLALLAPSPRVLSCPGIPSTVFGDAGKHAMYSVAAGGFHGGEREEDGEEESLRTFLSLFVILLFLFDFLDILFLSDGRGRLAAAAATTDSFPPSVSPPVGHVPRQDAPGGGCQKC